MELLNRFVKLRDAKTTALADKVRYQPTADYTRREEHDADLVAFFRGQYLLAGLSTEAERPGDYFCMDLAGLPIVVIRGEDGLLRALVNVCRHRGARVFPEDHGALVGRGVACPFHSWTYDMYGKLLGQPLAREGFRECDKNLFGLREVPVSERHGMVFVAPVTTDEEGAAGGAETVLGGTVDQDLADFGLGDYRLADRRTRTLELNWKLVMDTFLESYHIFSLHRESIGPYYFSAPNIYEEFEQSCLVAGVRSNVTEELEKPEAERSVLPFATLQYFIYPNTVLVHQFDHIETWQIFPGRGPGESVVHTTVYGKGEMTEKRKRYLTKNLDLVVNVTDNEDFPQAVRTQRAVEAGASDQFVFGRNEPGLIHYHTWLDQARVPA